MNSSSSLTAALLGEWQSIRQLTYDYLDLLDPQHLDLRLPFPESQTMGYQFWCMVGAHESYLKKLEHGAWQGFSSSLGQFNNVTPALIKQQMQLADTTMVQVLDQVDLAALQANGEPNHAIVFQMIKHEMHHHGQLINFLFCHHLSIPPTWRDEWSLQYGS